MKAWNKKRQPKHTTKVKWMKGIFMHLATYRNSKSKGLSDEIFGSDKFKAYYTVNYIN
ncbi:hypothetical protein [Fusobacterium varium]|uniref:hypothetical protein n=1 Tax=Fusobacterium varium TaxID=856 RepID=UPI003F101365